MGFEIIKELFLADATLLMSDVPYHRWGIINNAFDGEIANNLRYWLGGIDIDLIHIGVFEHSFTVFISLQSLEYGITEAWLDGHNRIHARTLLYICGCKGRKFRLILQTPEELFDGWNEKIHSTIQITNINQRNNHFLEKKYGLLGIIAYFCAQITII